MNEQKLDKIIKILLVIKNWIIFFGVITIISILSYIFFINATANRIEQLNNEETWHNRLKN